jgi:hypothetical protein
VDRVHGDPVQPGRELGPALKVVEAAKGAEEHVLRQIVRGRIVEDHRMDHAADRGQVPDGELIERPAVAGLPPGGHELLVGRFQNDTAPCRTMRRAGRPHLGSHRFAIHGLRCPDQPG